MAHLRTGTRGVRRETGLFGESWVGREKRAVRRKWEKVIRRPWSSCSQSLALMEIPALEMEVPLLDAVL